MDVYKVIRNNGDFLCHFRDNNFYKIVNLENNLTALLISSNNEDDNTASIALSVKAGSFDDPLEYEGLAHLVSNLIIKEYKFLNKDLIKENLKKKPGRKKNVKTNLENIERQTYSLMYLLQTTKGSIKLNTEYEYTTYQIDVPTEHLEQTLEDFYLRFYDLPTFTSYLIKETLKILKHEYYQKIKENSMMKLKMLICYLVEDNKLKNYLPNPFFDVQSEENIEKLRQELIKFLKNYYRPSHMKLVLKSNYSLEEMENLLEKTFSKLINEKETNNFEVVQNKITELFTKKFTENIYYISLLNKEQELEDYLPLRQNLMVFDLDVFNERVIDSQLDDKFNEKSLEKILFNKISFDSNNHLFSFSSFKQLALKENKENVDQLCFVFSLPTDPRFYQVLPMHFISSLICKEGPGTLASYLKRKGLIEKIKAGNLTDCNFSNNKLWNLFFIKICLTEKGFGSINQITSLLNSYLKMLTKLKNIDVLYKEYCKLMIFDYDFKEARKKSEQDLFLIAKKMHSIPDKYLLIAHRIPFSHPDKQILEKIIQLINLKKSLIIVNTNQLSFESVKKNSHIHKCINIKIDDIDEKWFETIKIFETQNFPKENLFIANNFQIKLERKVFTIPELINQNANSNLWYKKESSELLSLTSIKLLISNNNFNFDIKSSSLCDLMIIISEKQMQEILFQVKEAGFLYNIEYCRFGFVFSITGSSNKILEVYKAILNSFKTVFTAKNFDEAKKIIFNRYENALKNKFKIFLDLQNSLLFYNHWTIQQKIKIVSDLTLNDLTQNFNKFFTDTTREYLVQGNYTVEEANFFFDQIESMFNNPSKKKKPISNQTFNVNGDSLIEENISMKSRQELLSENELMPFQAKETYCFAKLTEDCPESLINEKSLSFELCCTPETSVLHQPIKHKNYIESTTIKNCLNRKLFIDTSSINSSCSSKLDKNSYKSSTSSLATSVCSGVIDYKFSNSSFNLTDEYQDFPDQLNQDSQIISNLYFTCLKDDTKHYVLLKTLIELIKKHINRFFKNEDNILEEYMSSDKINNENTPEITFLDQVFINGQIKCVEFELINSKGFLFIVIDNYLLLSTQSIEYLIDSFLYDYMFEIICNLDDQTFDLLKEQILNDYFKKSDWLEDIGFNWNEILTGKKRFNFKEEQKFFFRNFDKQFFQRWSCMTIQKMNRYSKLSLQMSKDSMDQNLDSKFCDKRKLVLLDKKILNNKKKSWVKLKVINNLDEYKKSWLNQKIAKENEKTKKKK